MPAHLFSVSARRVVAVASTIALSAAALIAGAPANATTSPSPQGVRADATIPVNACATKPPTPGKPVLSGLTFSTRSVNATKGPGKITVNVKGADTGKPISSISLSVTSPKKGNAQQFRSVSLSRISGTAKKGSWRGTLVIPRYYINGTWAVSSLYVNDSGGGFAYYTPTGGSPAYATWGKAWPKTITVKSTPDVVAPTLVKLTVSPASINTTKKSASTTITARVKDNLSGVSFVSVTARRQSTGQVRFFYLPLVKGTGLTRTAKSKVVIPRWLGPKKTWDLSVAVYDALDNGRTYNTAALAKLKVAKSLSITSTWDLSKPTLSSFAVSPTKIDIRKSAKTVKFTAGLKDTGSGVSLGIVTISTGKGSKNVSAYLTKTKGTINSGTWKGSVVVHPCDLDNGTATLTVTLYDLAGNTRSITSAQLKARKLRGTIAVTANDHTAPTVTAPSTIAAGSAFTLSFNEAVLFAKAPASLLTFERNGSVAPGTWSCKNGAGTSVSCAANGANVRKLTFTPTTKFAQFDSLSVESTSFSVSGIYDTHGNALSPVFIFASVS
jgi:Bacterial Ig-like domain